MDVDKLTYFVGLSYDPSLAFTLSWFKSQCRHLQKQWEKEHPGLKNYPPIFFDNLKNGFVWLGMENKNMDLYVNLVQNVLDSNNCPGRVWQQGHDLKGK